MTAKPFEGTTSLQETEEIVVVDYSTNSSNPNVHLSAVALRAMRMVTSQKGRKTRNAPVLRLRGFILARGSVEHNFNIDAAISPRSQKPIWREQGNDPGGVNQDPDRAGCPGPEAIRADDEGGFIRPEQLTPIGHTGHRCT
jgi:hypothetical protein